MTVRRIAAVAGAAALVLSLTACGGDDEPVNAGDDLVIGVSGTDPRVAMVNADGSFSGFDVDIASYVAKGLGWNDRDVVFQMVEPDQRERALATGDVDMVVSTYAMTEESRKAVDFAGPYFVAGQDLLVGKDSTVTGPRSLETQMVCAQTGSPAFAGYLQAFPEASLRGADSVGDCVDLLLAGEVKAVTADDVVLAGHAAEHSADLKVVGSPFATSYYGIGLPKGSPDVAAVDALLARAIDDGTWQADVDRNFAGSGYVPPLPPTPGSPTL